MNSDPDTPPRTGAIERRPFGELPDGRRAELFILRNSRGMVASISSYGGILTSLTIPDWRGSPADVVLGHDQLGAYLKGRSYFGAIIGRYANRIRGSAFTLDGEPVTLTRNDGRNHLHGGTAGFDRALWTALPRPSSSGPQLELAYSSADGEEGHPGRLDATVTFTLTHHNELRIRYRATTSRPTHVNLTHHSYFNLAGQESDHILDHILTIDADRFTAVDAELIPTGEMRRVDNSPMDFRKPVAIGARIDSDDEQLRFGRGYDHNWVLNGADPDLHLAARVLDPASGRQLEVLTSEPGVQFYSGNCIDGTLIGKRGRIHKPRCAFCLETQHFPDSPNQSTFPSTVLRPGERYDTITVYRFQALRPNIAVGGQT